MYAHKELEEDNSEMKTIEAVWKKLGKKIAQTFRLYQYHLEWKVYLVFCLVFEREIKINKAEREERAIIFSLKKWYERSYFQKLLQHPNKKIYICTRKLHWRWQNFN